MSETQQQQQVDHLKHQIDTGAQEAKSYLDKLKKNIHEYDEKHPSAQKATDVLCSGLDAAEASVNELAHVGAKLKAKSKKASSQSMELARETLLKVKASLCALQDKAHEYDAKFTGSAGKVAGEVSDSVESIVNSMRQRTIDAIEMATEQITRMSDSAQNAAGTAAHGAQVTAGESLRVGDKVDEKLGASEKASGAVGVVAETVKNIDQRMHVTETAAAIDSTITGGLGARVVNKGVEIVQGSIEYVAETLQQAKNAATKSGTAQAADDKAAGAIDSADATAGAAQDKAMAAKGHAADAAYNARDKTMETAGSIKDQAVDAAYIARDKTVSAKDQAVDAAYNARDKTMETAGSIKDQVVGAAYNAVDKTMEMATSAKDHVVDAAHVAVDKTMEMAGLAKQSAYETAETTKHKAQGAAATAQQKGAEMYEGARQGAESAKQSAYETAETAKHKAQNTAGAAEQKGAEMYEGARQGAESAKQSAHETAKHSSKHKTHGAHKGSDISHTGTGSGTGTHSGHVGSSGRESTGSGANDLVFTSVTKHAAHGDKSETPAGNVVIEVKHADTASQSTGAKSARKA